MTNCDFISMSSNSIFSSFSKHLFPEPSELPPVPMVTVSAPPAWSPWWSGMSSSSSGSSQIQTLGREKSRGIISISKMFTFLSYFSRLHYYKLKIVQDAHKTKTVTSSEQVQDTKVLSMTPETARTECRDSDDTPPISDSTVKGT